MDPLVKRLIATGVVGLIVTWGTFLVLELAPEDEELEPVEDEPVAEPRASVSAKKRLERARIARITTAKRKRPERNVPPVRPPVVNRPAPPPAPQQIAAIKSPSVPDLPPKLPTPTEANPANTTQAALFSQMEKSYETEERDADWADEKEKRVLDLFKKGDLEETLADISCRKTLCRIEVRINSPETFMRVFKLPGLAEEIGLNAAAQPLGEGEDRRMVSFIRRKEATR